MDINQCLTDYGYKKIGDYYVKGIKNDRGNVVINAMFSVKYGHNPLRINCVKDKRPEIEWSNNHYKKYINPDNIKLLCENVEQTARKFRIMEIKYVLSTVKQDA